MPGGFASQAFASLVGRGLMGFFTPLLQGRQRDRSELHRIDITLTLDAKCCASMVYGFSFEDGYRSIVLPDLIGSKRKERIWRTPDGFLPGVAEQRMTGTILLIDDNAVQAATRQTILKRAGYFVIAALNPMRALEQFQSGEFPAEIRLVITDHLMPGMSGADFVRGLRKTHPTMPVMVISGLPEAEEDYADLNVTFRQKPLLPELLLAKVQSLLQSQQVGQADATGSSVR